MKHFLFLSIFILLSSCSWPQYIAKRDRGNFEKLEAGQTYIFFHKNSSIKMKLVSMEKDSIIGLKNKTRISLSKNTISNVSRNNTAGTVILVGSVIGTVVLIGVLVANFLDGAAQFGDAIGGQ